MLPKPCAKSGHSAWMFPAESKARREKRTTLKSARLSPRFARRTRPETLRPLTTPRALRGGSLRPLKMESQKIVKDYSSPKLGAPIEDWKKTTFEFRRRRVVIHCAPQFSNHEDFSSQRNASGRDPRAADTGWRRQARQTWRAGRGRGRPRHRRRFSR